MLNKSNLIRAVAGLLIAAFFVYFAFKGISFSKLLRDSLQANLYLLLLTVLIVLVSHVIRALRWRAIIQELKEEVSPVNVWGSIMVGYLFNNFFPQLGEVVRGYVVGRLEDVRVSGIFGTIVLERLFDMISSGILFGVALYFYNGGLIDSFPVLRILGVVLVAGSLVIGGFLYMASVSENIQQTLLRLVRRFLPAKFAHRVETVILSFLAAFRLLRSKRRVGTITLYTGVLWLVYVFTMYIPFFAFAFGARLHLTFFDAFLLMLVSSVAWTLPSPGGIGVYHLLVSQALVIISGVSKVEALAYASVTFLFSYVAITVVGSVFVFVFTRKLKSGPLSLTEVTRSSADASWETGADER